MLLIQLCDCLLCKLTIAVLIITFQPHTQAERDSFRIAAEEKIVNLELKVATIK